MEITYSHFLTSSLLNSSINVLHASSEVELNNIDSFILNEITNPKAPHVITSICSINDIVPLEYVYTDNSVVHNNCIIIGDSAHAVHPFAGQGINLGIADCALLSNALSKGKDSGKRLNDKKNSK